MSRGAFRKDARFIRRAREQRTIAAMLRRYCHAHHAPGENLCPACSVLLDYAQRRLQLCPFGDAKPTCNKCQVHCYSRERRQEIREVMRWAGPRMLRQHPLLGIRHLIDGWRPTPRLPEKRQRPTKTTDSNESL